MIRQCDECDVIYDDVDHWTYCPHQRFTKPPARVIEIIGQAVVADRPLTPDEQHELGMLGYPMLAMDDRFRQV